MCTNLHRAIGFVWTFVLLAVSIQSRAATLNLDLSYGGNADAEARVVFGSEYDSASALFETSDGKLLVAGVNGQNNSEPAFLARLEPDGSVDTSFGPNGDGHILLIDGLTIAAAVTLSDGRVVFAGSANQNAVIGRLTAAGLLDKTFNGSGYHNIGGSAFFPTGNAANFVRLFALSNGETVAIGTAAGGGQACGTAVMFAANGATDLSYGLAGLVCVGPAYGDSVLSEVRDAVKLGDGSILLGGDGFHNGGSSSDMLVGKLLPSGSLDTNFGSSGWAIAAFDRGGSLAEDGDVMSVDSLGRIWLAGEVATTDGSTAAIARFLSSGQLDTAFGFGGTVTPDVGMPVSARVFGIYPQADGQSLIALGMQESIGSTPTQSLAYIKNDGTLDTHRPASLVPLPANTTYGVATTLRIGDAMYFPEVLTTSYGFGIVKGNLSLFSDGFD